MDRPQAENSAGYTGKRILILATGGTIGSIETPKGATPKEGLINELVDQILSDGTLSIAREGITVRDITKLIDSTNMTPERQNLIIKEIHAALHPDTGVQPYDAVIVTHGTDTLEHLVARAAFAMQTGKPIIATGSSILPLVKGTDAMRNLRDSIITAFTLSEKGIGGIFVVFNRKVMPGIWTYEYLPENINAFRSVMGSIATLKGNALKFVNGNGQRGRGVGEIVPNLDLRLNGNTAIFMASPDADPREARESLSKGVQGKDGLLFITYPSLGVPDHLEGLLEGISKEIAVVVTTGVPGGKAKKYEVSRSIIHPIIGFGVRAPDEVNLRYTLGTADNVKNLEEVTDQFEINKVKQLLGGMHVDIKKLDQQAVMQLRGDLRDRSIASALEVLKRREEWIQRGAHTHTTHTFLGMRIPFMGQSNNQNPKIKVHT